MYNGGDFKGKTGSGGEFENFIHQHVNYNSNAVKKYGKIYQLIAWELKFEKVHHYAFSSRNHPHCAPVPSERSDQRVQTCAYIPYGCPHCKCMSPLGVKWAKSHNCRKMVSMVFFHRVMM